MTVVQIARARGAAVRRTRPQSPLGYFLVLFSVGALLAGGLVVILSASSVASYQRFGSSFLYFNRQLTWAGAGVVAMVAMSRVDYRRLRAASYVLFAVALLGLLAVLHPALGVTAGGSSRWIGVGSFRVQPSELMKLALVLVAADLCARKAHRLWTFRDVVLPLGLMAALAGVLVLAQPDLGTTLILGVIVFAALFAAGTSLPVLGGLGVLAGSAALALSVTEGYRRARLLSFLNPFRDPLNTGYQAVQGLIALGSGGLFGVGLGASRQKWLYIPNAHTDFIFSIIGEEMGLVGTLAVVALFALLAYGGIRVACRAPDVFGRLVAAGITAWIVGQAVVNMGAVTGLLPITGVPLPLVSFGGSSLVVTLAGAGVLLNIARHERPPQGPPARSRPGTR